MSRSAPKATRSALLRLTQRLGQVDKGTALLQKKRDALVGELFARVHPGVDARRRIEQQAARAWPALVDSLAAAGAAGNAVLGWPRRDLHAGITAALPEPAHSAPPARRSIAARGWVPGQFEPAADDAARALESLVEQVLAAAPEEAAIRRLGRELERTVRQVNMLERRVAVDLRHTLRRLRATLDEREREAAMRLRRIAASRQR